MSGVEAQEAVKHPSMHRTVPPPHSHPSTSLLVAPWAPVSPAALALAVILHLIATHPTERVPAGFCG